MLNVLEKWAKIRNSKCRKFLAACEGTIAKLKPDLKPA